MMKHRTIKTDSLHNLGPLRSGEKQGIEHKCLLPHGISGTKHDASCVTPAAAIRGYAQGQYKILCHTVNNGADCDALARDLEAAFPSQVIAQTISHVIANTHSQYTTASPSELLSATPDFDALGRHPRWRSILHEWCGIDTNSMSDVISNTQV
jgi:hypothetical protein